MIIIIAAVAKNRVIGKQGKLPWNIPEDMKLFRRLTEGNVIVMGRKTFESLGRPLPNRHNIIITSSEMKIKGADICHSVEEALKKAKSYGKDIFIIGGSQIFKETLPIAGRMYISHVKKDYEGDAYFPEFDKADWLIEKKEGHKEFELVVYRRR